MTREEAIKVLERIYKCVYVGDELFEAEKEQALDMAIEALEFDEIVFDMNEFFSIIDDGKITVMRRGKRRVAVERPGIRLETTICSYGERSEE